MDKRMKVEDARLKLFEEQLNANKCFEEKHRKLQVVEEHYQKEEECFQRLINDLTSSTSDRFSSEENLEAYNTYKGKMKSFNQPIHSGVGRNTAEYHERSQYGKGTVIIKDSSDLELKETLN